MNRAISVLLAFALLLAYQPLPITALAQNTGEISGTAVVEGKPLPGVTIRLRNIDNGQLVGNMTTNEKGEFRFTGLPPGNFVVETVAPNGTLLGTSAKIALVAGAMVATGVAVSMSAAAAAAAGVGAGAAAGAAGAEPLARALRLAPEQGPLPEPLGRRVLRHDRRHRDHCRDRRRRRRGRCCREWRRKPSVVSQRQAANFLTKGQGSCSGLCLFWSEFDRIFDAETRMVSV